MTAHRFRDRLPEDGPESRAALQAYWLEAGRIALALLMRREAGAPGRRQHEEPAGGGLAPGFDHPG